MGKHGLCYSPCAPFAAVSRSPWQPRRFVAFVSTSLETLSWSFYALSNGCFDSHKLWFLMRETTALAVSSIDTVLALFPNAFSAFATAVQILA